MALLTGTHAAGASHCCAFAADMESVCSLDAEASEYDDELDVFPPPPFSPAPRAGLRQADSRASLKVAVTRSEGQEDYSLEDRLRVLSSREKSPNQVHLAWQEAQIILSPSHTSSGTRHNPTGITWIGIESGVEQEGCNAQVHALELEYQQEQFEQTQQGGYSPHLLSFPPEGQRLLGLSEQTSSTMKEKEETTSLKRPKSIRLKLGAKVKNRGHPSSTKLMLVTPMHGKEESVTTARRTSVCLNDLPISFPLDKSAAAKITQAVLGESASTWAMEQYDFSVEVFKEKVSLTDCAESNRPSARRVDDKSIQTEGFRLVEQNVQTEGFSSLTDKMNQEPTVRSEVGVQVHEASSLKTNAQIQVTEFDKASIYRFSHQHRTHMRYIHTLQPIQEEMGMGGWQATDSICGIILQGSNEKDRAERRKASCHHNSQSKHGSTTEMTSAQIGCDSTAAETLQTHTDLLQASCVFVENKTQVWHGQGNAELFQSDLPNDPTTGTNKVVEDGRLSREPTEAEEHEQMHEPASDDFVCPMDEVEGHKADWTSTITQARGKEDRLLVREEKERRRALMAEYYPPRRTSRTRPEINYSDSGSHNRRGLMPASKANSRLGKRAAEKIDEADPNTDARSRRKKI